MSHFRIETNEYQSVIEGDRSNLFRLSQQHIGLTEQKKILNLKHEDELFNFIVKYCITCAMEDSNTMYSLFVITTLDKIVIL